MHWVTLPTRPAAVNLARPGDATRATCMLAARMGAASGVVAALAVGTRAAAEAEPGPGSTSTSRLLAAAYVGDVRLVQALLTGGVANVNDTDTDGWSALLLAASQGHSQLARVLVGLGANVEFRLDGDVTPLHMASINGHSDMVTILVRDGGALVDARSVDAKTALMIAAANGHDDVVTALLDLGADIEARDKHG